jgi:GT2 family glycosyltransferase
MQKISSVFKLADLGKGNLMKIAFQEVTRGHEKIFIHLKFDEPINGIRIIASSVTTQGLELPTKLIEVPEIDGRVLVLPVLSVNQRVKITALFADGSKAECSKEIAPFIAKLHSQLNTARKNCITEKIRNCDANQIWGFPDVKVIRVIQKDESSDIVHGEVTVRGSSLQSISGDVDVQVLSRDGFSVALKPWLSMGDSSYEPEDLPGSFIRTIIFSVCIKRNVKGLIFIARFNNDQIANGFEGYQGRTIREFRDAWKRRTLSADADPFYEEWFLSQRADPKQLELQRQRHFAIEPEFSFIVPAFHTPLDYFKEMADSVLSQSYGRLELIIVNASSEDRKLAALIDDYVKQDNRVHEICLDHNLGITENTNIGIRAAKGDFVCFLDHDDVIEQDLLFNYVRGLNQYPTTDLFYCDEDKLHGEHYESVFFKPDWNIDLLCSFNYVCHLLTVRHSVLDKVGLSNAEFDGSQDHNLTFKVGEVARNIYHARRVLYHWRIHEGSTAAAVAEDTKPYAVTAGVLAVQSHLDRCHIVGTVTDVPSGYKIQYHFVEQPLVSIVIPNNDSIDILDRCIDSIIKRSTYPDFEIVVVENNSKQDATFEYYEQLQAQYHNVRVVSAETNGRFNFSKVVNFGFKEAKGDYLLMLNNDVEVISPDWIEQMLGPCLRKDVGAVGAKLIYPDGTLQHAGVCFQKEFGPDHLGKFLLAHDRRYYDMLNRTQDLSAVTGACLLTKRQTFNLVRELDEQNFAVDYNDVDFCLKVRSAGFLVVYTPFAELNHFESASRGMHDSKEKRIRFRRERGSLEKKWPKYYEYGDPYMSPSFNNDCKYRGF